MRRTSVPHGQIVEKEARSDVGRLEFRARPRRRGSRAAEAQQQQQQAGEKRRRRWQRRSRPRARAQDPLSTGRRGTIRCFVPDSVQVAREWRKKLVLAVPTACGRREPRAAATVLLQVGFGVEERLCEFFKSTPSRQAHQWTTSGMYLAEIYWYLRVFVSSVYWVSIHIL